MEKKQIVLKNRGMNRDTSVSKIDGSAAYENHNIRIIAREEDTFLTVTNERGTKEINLGGVIPGSLLGWNVLNNHIILFTHIENEGTIDKIYRVDYENGEFSSTLLYTGHLGFEFGYPIESVVHFETEAIQKIYWIDGKNVLRFMNFMATTEERALWDDTTFDSNRAASFDIDVKITKDSSGENRPNGVAQYLLTYFNKHGQETGHVWFSDIVYLSPKNSGGAADSTNNDRVVLNISNLDTSFTNFRVYSIFRSSLDGQVVAYLVDEQKTTSETATVIDDGAHLQVEDTTRLLYLGSQHVVADAITHKDNTLFLGNLKSVGRANYDDLETMIKTYLFDLEDNSEFVDGETYKSACVEFIYSNARNIPVDDVKYIPDIPYDEDAGMYPYSNQLRLTSSEILTFKGGEKYRFALKFQYANGVETDAFWIGDVENTLYPVIDNKNHVIRRVVAKCELPTEFIVYLKSTPFKTVRLCIAEATYADRSVKAQGIVNPTMFNVWERFNERIYSVPTWTSRVRSAEYPYLHFDPVDRSDSSYGEIQCNWWDEDIDHNPFYQYKNYDDDAGGTFLKDLGRENDWDQLMLVYRLRYKENKKTGWITATTFATGLLLAGKVKFKILVYAIKAKYNGNYAQDTDAVSAVNNAVIAAYDDEENKDNGKKQHSKEFDAYWTFQTDPDTGAQGYYHPITIQKTINGVLTTVEVAKLHLTKAAFSASTIFNQGGAKNDAYKKLVHTLVDMGLDRYAPTAEEFVAWCTYTTHARSPHTHRLYVNQNLYTGAETPLQAFECMKDAVNATALADRWISEGEYSTIGDSGAYAAAYYKKHLMFVDENTITLDSPELDKNLVVFDKKDKDQNSNLKFRIVGFAKMSSVISDYTIDATHSNVDGASYDDETFSGRKNIAGLISWPLWREYSLNYTQEEGDNDYKEENERASSDYELGSRIIRYFLYMWHHNGSITGFNGRTDDKDEEDADDNLTVVDRGYSILNHKTWANLRFSHTTIYMNNFMLYNPDNIRISQEYGNAYLNLAVGSKDEAYNGNVQFSMSMPGDLKYPLYYSNIHKDKTYEEINADGAYLYSNIPIQLEYGTKTHAVISLGTNEAFPETAINPSTHEPYLTGNYNYSQVILPYCFEQEKVDFSELKTDNYTDENETTAVKVTGALLPWVDEQLTENYLFFENGGITQPIYTPEVHSDADTQYYFKASVANTGDGLNYVKAINDALNYFGDEDVYMTVNLPDSLAPATVGTRMVMRLADLEVEEDTVHNEFDLKFRDPKVIDSSDGTDAATSETEKKLMVRYVVPNSTNTGVDFMGAATLHIWNNTIDQMNYPYRDYRVDQGDLRVHRSNYYGISDELEEGDKYLFVGEIYADCGSGSNDNRYGGINEANVKNNRFISAGPAYAIANLWDGEEGISANIYANQGDTYFQRWDSFRIKPFSNDSLNQNIDIVSAMLETHVNIDGRTDLQRGIPQLASIDQPQFNSINSVYSQKNNFIVRRDEDKDANTDSYRATVTWTLPKADMADVDEWTHITLANTLKLDGDKGWCRSLNRFANRIISFQDSAISEIMFNEMTQIGTQDGVPIEIANSGKVSGKYYFTNKYGCVNKWSISEGKSSLYFVDNINKAFCSVSVGQRGQLGVADISTGKGFSMWFKRTNNMKSWEPVNFSNIISFYDKVRSDVYLVKADSDVESPCLVYNELLGEFTSFFDYGSVPMIANVNERLVSYKRGRMWLQNEGIYCNFFGTQYDFWTQYRVTPDPYGDKIWTNLEYRADFYKMIDGDVYTRFEDLSELDGAEGIIAASGYLYALGPQNDKIHLAEQTAGSVSDDTRILSDQSTALTVKFEYDPSDDTYSIQNITEGSDNYGKYLSWAGSELLSGKNLMEDDEPFWWYVDINDQDGVMTITPPDDDDYWVQFNRSATRFCCYKSTQASIAFFVKSDDSVQRDDLTESSFTDDKFGMYEPDKTFDYIRFWNEYQTTKIEETNKISPDKKFRIWRFQIPRAIKEGTNIYGLDRMRNPWLNILLKKKYSNGGDDNKDLMQMHDMTVIYYE